MDGSSGADVPNLVLVPIVIPLDDWCALDSLSLANVQAFPAEGFDEVAVLVSLCRDQLPELVWSIILLVDVNLNSLGC